MNVQKNPGSDGRDTTVGREDPSLLSGRSWTRRKLPLTNSQRSCVL